jgi:hypothetical protein
LVVLRKSIKFLCTCSNLTLIHVFLGSAFFFLDKKETKNHGLQNQFSSLSVKP